MGRVRAWQRFRNAGGGTHDGLSAREFERALVFHGLPLEAPVVRELFARLDADGSGEIDFEEFVEMFNKLGQMSSGKRPVQEPDLTPGGDDGYIMVPETYVAAPPPQHARTPPPPKHVIVALAPLP